MNPEERDAREDPFREGRERMVATQIAARGVRDERVLAAMRKVPREVFVRPGMEAEAYFDHPLPIGCGQTISQPYIVALMSELAELKGGETVLEVGTGCGYQTAVLAELARAVYSREIVPELAERAARTLAGLGYANVVVRAGDGNAGWPEKGPFEAVVVTAAPARVPKALLEQLKEGGRLVAPEGDEDKQMLRVYRREGAMYAVKDVLPVRFVPMIRR